MPFRRSKTPWRTPGQREIQLKNPYTFLAIIVVALIVVVSASFTQTGMVIQEDSSGLCDNITCSDSSTTCPDGYESICQETCDNTTGLCVPCEPTCDGHDYTCDLECGECQALDDKNCECLDVSPCLGNAVCESGEYPSEDCPDCDDENECTEDNYDHNTRECTHENICPGSHVIITHIQYKPVDPNHYPERDFLNDEWVEIRNIGNEYQSLDSWILKDDAGHEYTFSSFVVLYPNETVRIHTGIGLDSSTDIYWGYGNAIWNNDSDMATLMDRDRNIIDVYSYTGE